MTGKLWSKVQDYLADLHLSSTSRALLGECVFRRGFSATPSVWPCSLCWRGCSATTPDASTQPKRSKETQRDPKSTRKTRAAEGWGSTQSEKGKKYHQGSIKKGMKTEGKTAALPALLLCAFKAWFHLSACLSCGRRSDLDDASFLEHRLVHPFGGNLEVTGTDEKGISYYIRLY